MADYATAIRRTDRAKVVEARALERRNLAETRQDAAFAALVVALARESRLDHVAPTILADAIRQVAILCTDPAASANADPRMGTNGDERSSARRVRQEDTPPAGSEGLTFVIVTVGGNVGIVKKECLQRNGLRWNGRDGHWRGWTTPTGIDDLRAVIGANRIEKKEIGVSDPPPTKRNETSECGSSAGQEIAPRTVQADDDAAANQTMVDRIATTSRRTLPPSREDTPAYRYAEIVPFDPAVELFHTPDDGVMSMALNVIEQEGPVHKDEIFARIRAAYGLKNISPALKLKLERIPGKIDHSIVLREEQFFVFKNALIAVRDRRDAKDQTRHYRHLSLIELRIAVMEERETNPGLAYSTAVTCIARRMGYLTTSYGLTSRIGQAWNNVSASEATTTLPSLPSPTSSSELPL